MNIIMFIWRYQEVYDKTIIIISNNNNIIDFPADDNNISFKYKEQITGQTENSGEKNVEIMVPLKYLSNFWRKLEMPSINCEINLQLK